MKTNLIDACLKEYKPKINYFLGDMKNVFSFIMEKALLNSFYGLQELLIVVPTAKEIKSVEKEILFLPFEKIGKRYCVGNLVKVSLFTLAEVKTIECYCDYVIYYQGNKNHKKELDRLLQLTDKAKKGVFMFFTLIPHQFFLYTGFDYTKKGIQVRNNSMVVFDYE